MSKLSVLVLTISLVAMLSCSQTDGKVSEELEQQIQIESYQFEELLAELSKHISTMSYPQDIPLEPIIPDNWVFKCRESGTSDTPSEYVLGIPVPQGIKTGLTVIRAKDNWVTFQRTTYLEPNTDFYIVSSMP